MILLLSSTGDVTTDYVVRALDERGANSIRINTNNLLNEWQIEITPDSMRLETDDVHFTPSDVTAVYYRRAYPPSPQPQTHPASWAFVAREAQVAVRALYATLECPWISHHAAIAAAENKPRQIRLARHIGFNVPETMITNEADKAHSFFDAHEHVVTKAISYGDLGGGKVLHTSIVRKWSGEFAQEIGLCPVLLQQYIDKAYEYRVTVVDDQVFSCRIESQIHADYAVDMRRGLADPEMTHRLISLPKKVEQTCIALVKTLGLRFGAIDLAQDHDGKIWFLEINPNGQWAWIEDRTGAQISSALAEGLLTNA